MGTITIIGAGAMGTAMAWPAADNGHTVNLVGTHLDDAIIDSIKENGLHPKLKRAVPKNVNPFKHTDLSEALKNSDLVISGVSSLGVDWIAETAGPLLDPAIPFIAVTKGLMSRSNGEIITLPVYLSDRIQQIANKQVRINAITGPCIAQELAARRHTCVVFCGENVGTLEKIRSMLQISYYQVATSLDITSLEVCAAMKNAYAVAINLAVGEFEVAGVDGNANYYNPQAALFAQGMREMELLIEILGGNPKSVIGLPGSGDLYVTVFGGRSARLGKLLGRGIPYQQALQDLAGETLESVEIARQVIRALPALEKAGRIPLNSFPLLRHLSNLIETNNPAPIPWEKFFSS
jgi:glycerol-3-phosphate dehydrogenase (NAD(P)+)